MSQQSSTVWGLGGQDLPTKAVTDIDYDHPNGTSINDIPDLTFEPLGTQVDVHAKFNMSNITQITNFKLMEKLDGTTYRQTKIWTWDTDNDDTSDESLVLEFVGVGVDAKITIQSTVAEGNIKTILGKKALYTY